MKNIKLMLFEFKNSLTIDQLDESKIAQNHMNAYDEMSELEIVNSLNESLKSYSYDSNVKGFLEAVNTEVKANNFLLELKDLYKRVERQNLGMLYRQPLVTILEIINQENDESRMEAVLNDLSIYDWVPEIKQFLLAVTADPMERENFVNSGKAEKVFTVTERFEEGNAVWIADRWFMISEDEIKQINIDDYIQDEERRKEIRILENVLRYANITEEKISFKVDEHLTLAISTADANVVFMNNDKLDEESTLESIFNSPLVPELRKGNYVLLETAKNNIDKFIELDLAIKVENVLKPFVENICFNYKDKIYMYTVDTRAGSKFYKYNNASEIIQDVQRELDYDLSNFYENKLSKEMKELKKLEDQEKSLDIKLTDVHESLAMLIENEELMNESIELKDAFDELNKYKLNLTKRLEAIKAKKNEAKRTIVNK